MSKRSNGYGTGNRVNILKKVKVSATWNLYPAVVEPNGKLRDKVLVRGKVQVHPEGYYYIEWWQDGRKREQIKDRAEVIDRARRKAIELEANRAGIETVQERATAEDLRLPRPSPHTSRTWSRRSANREPATCKITSAT
jgi:hypothetical protein